MNTAVLTSPLEWATLILDLSGLILGLSGLIFGIGCVVNGVVRGFIRIVPRKIHCEQSFCTNSRMRGTLWCKRHQIVKLTSPEGKS